MPAGALTTADARDQLIAGAEKAGSVGEVFAGASRRLRRLIAFDAAVWLASDPATGLPTAPTRTENMGRFGIEACLRSWELGFTVQDVNLYRDLARSDSPAGALRLATRDRPARSPRHRELMAPNGFADELRAVMRVDGNPWASIGLFRERGRPAFTTADIALLAGISAPVATAVRDHARRRRPPDPPVRIPAPACCSSTPAASWSPSTRTRARGWRSSRPDGADQGGFGVRLPMVAAAALMRARAIAEDRDHGTARARLRSRATGRWLVCHASCLCDADGVIGNTALVIELASASEVAPIIVQAHELSAREQQITQLIARGHGTADIAAGLHLSTHTVRDYIKAIFEKVGVSSRGELVAKLFAEHYVPLHLTPDGVERVDGD